MTVLEEKYAVIQEDDSPQVKELKQKINRLQAQLDIQQRRTESMSGGNLLNSAPIDLYPGEQHDFVLSILEQAREKCPPDSRPRDILDSILGMNTPVGHGEEILNELERIFSRGIPSTDSDISDLKAIGFSYTQSRKHPKLRFHDKYMFVIPNTPSDVRSAKNMLSQISKCIAVSQKI